MEINTTLLNLLKNKTPDIDNDLKDDIEVNYQNNKVDNFTSNISSQLKRESAIRKQSYDTEINPPDTYQKINSNLNYLDCCLDLDLLECPITVNDNLWYCLICASFPIFANFSYNVQMENIKKIKQKFAYDLDEKMFYDRYTYKIFGKKTEIQNKLLNNEIIFGPIIREYFSDYFNVNIFMIYNKLIVETCNNDNNDNNDNPNIFILSQYPKVSVVTIDNGRGLFNKIEASHLLETFTVRVSKIKPITKYKIDEIKKIAESLKISLTVIIENKEKRRKKQDLYTDICNILCYC